MIELKRKVKKTVEETYQVELKTVWNVRVLRPNGNRTYYCSYEQEFSHEPSEEEIANILAEYGILQNQFVSVCKNYKLAEIEVEKNED